MIGYHKHCPFLSTHSLQCTISNFPLSPPLTHPSASSHPHSLVAPTLPLFSLTCCSHSPPTLTLFITRPQICACASSSYCFFKLHHTPPPHIPFSLSHTKLTHPCPSSHLSLSLALSSNIYTPPLTPLSSSPPFLHHFLVLSLPLPYSSPNLHHPCPLSLHYNEGNYQLHHKLFLPPITVSLHCTPPLPSLLPLKPPKPPLSPIPHPIIHYLIPTTPPPSALTIA